MVGLAPKEVKSARPFAEMAKELVPRNAMMATLLTEMDVPTVARSKRVLFALSQEVLAPPLVVTANSPLLNFAMMETCAVAMVVLLLVPLKLDGLVRRPDLLAGLFVEIV